MLTAHDLNLREVCAHVNIFYVSFVSATEDRTVLLKAEE
jgi:hypothetical protein